MKPKYPIKPRKRKNIRAIKTHSHLRDWDSDVIDCDNVVVCVSLNNIDVNDFDDVVAIFPINFWLIGSAVTKWRFRGLRKS